MARRPTYGHFARVTSALQEILGLPVDGLIRADLDEEIGKALKGFDGNAPDELLDYLADLHHIEVEKAPPKPVEEKAKQSVEKSGMPHWLWYALQFDGEKEIKGRRHNPRILSLFKLAHLPFVTDETPWCAAAVCAWLEMAGYMSPRNGMAKSFLQYGDQLDMPRRGAIIVFHRGRPKSPYGHVALCTEDGYVFDARGRKCIAVFGGNQGDTACHKDYPAIKLCKGGIRWPKDRVSAPYKWSA